MEIEVTNRSAPIDFSYTGIEEIAQNVRMILGTRKGSVPLDRDFGIDYSIIDKPSIGFMQKLKLEIIRQIEKYEPRVKVKKISLLDINSDGECLISLLLEIDT